MIHDAVQGGVGCRMLGVAVVAAFTLASDSLRTMIEFSFRAMLWWGAIVSCRGPTVPPGGMALRSDRATRDSATHFGARQVRFPCVSLSRESSWMQKLRRTLARASDIHA